MSGVDGIGRMRREIEHVVYLMLENRGFDHLLGYLYDKRNAPARILGRTDEAFQGVPNPAPKLPKDPSYYKDPAGYDGKWVSPTPAEKTHCCLPSADPGEQYADVLQQLYGPPRDPSLPEAHQNLGFYLDWQDNRGDAKASEIMVMNTDEQLPVLHGLAKAFAVSDQYFSSVPTQTNPNRAFSLAGTSLGRVINEGPLGVGKPFECPTTLFNAFDAHDRSWAIFYPEPWYGAWLAGEELQCYTRYMYEPLRSFENDGEHFRPHEEFLKRAKSGELPALSYLEPTFIGNQFFTPVSSYHPPSSLGDGERFLLEVYAALRASPKWDKTLLIVNFDEHGGTYDHMPTPTNAICPDESPSYFDFTRYGVRVPLLLISPWIEDSVVLRPESGDLPFDHTSVLATLLDWQNIPFRTADGPTYEFGARTRAAPGFAHVFDDKRHHKPAGDDLQVARCKEKHCDWETTGPLWGDAKGKLVSVIGKEKAEALFEDFRATGITKADLARWMNILFARAD